MPGYHGETHNRVGLLPRHHPELKLRATKRRRVNPAFGRGLAKSPVHGALFLARRFTCGCS